MINKASRLPLHILLLENNQIKFLHFLQDKALAALAIEDKKMQYAAAEKYLEDVLQSALATSE